MIGLVFCCSLSLADPLSGMFSSSFKIVKSFYDEMMNESERFTFAISILAFRFVPSRGQTIPQSFSPKNLSWYKNFNLSQ